MKTNKKNNIVESCQNDKPQSVALLKSQLNARENRVADLFKKVYNANNINSKGANVRACDIVPNAYSYAEAIAEEWHASEKTSEDYSVTKNKLGLLHKAITDGNLYKIVFSWTWSESGLVTLKVKDLTDKPFYGLTEHKITSGEFNNSLYSWTVRSHSLRRLLISSYDPEKHGDGVITQNYTLPMFRNGLDLNGLCDFLEKLGWTTTRCCIPHRGQDLYVAISDKR